MGGGQGSGLEAGHDGPAGARRLRIWLGRHVASTMEIIEGPRGRHTETPAAPGGEDADRALTALYDEHYSALVRQAWLLTGDTATAEAVVQDAFVALHAAWHTLHDAGRAVCYLRQSVLHRSRAARPRGSAAACGAPAPIIAALRALPPRQREALVLCYYAGLSAAEAAAIMRISERAARYHVERATAALRPVLDPTGTAAGGLLIAS